MLARLERILLKLAQQHAPHLVTPNWAGSVDPTLHIQEMARKLAAYNILVLVGDTSSIAPAEQDNAVRDWIKEVGKFYNLLAHGLFPSISKISAYYADDNIPPVVVINGQATPVITSMAGFVNPYLAVRGPQRVISELELRGLMNIVLDELEAEDLPRAAYNQLQEGGANILKKLLESRVRHVSVTTFDRPILSDIQNMPGIVKPPPTPGKLPEQERLKYDLQRLPEDKSPQTPTEEMFRVELPLGKTRPLPPIPRLPDEGR